MLPPSAYGTLRWGADHAWLADPVNPIRSVRRWCRRWAPWLTGAELDQLVDETKTSNKRWSHDDSAVTLGITVRDRQTLSLWFVGASDDRNYEMRLGIAKAKAAARARKSRAKNSSGRPPGRPRLEIPAWKAAGYNSKRTYQRHKALGTLAQNGTENASRSLSKNRKRDGIKVPPLMQPSVDLAGIDFERFGILKISVMKGRNVVSTWSRP
ncbi:hypothetical protein AC629_27880 [Bradyrhizobium sp. NAS80.1]|nr:hypothetical protein AC629_27880 [Bradyrhizobium sp. NAS80.1]